MKTTMIPPSELIINDDGSIFHLHLRPEQLADRIILVGDPARVTMIGEYLDEKEWCYRLIFSGKVKIYIGLFIPLKWWYPAVRRYIALPAV